MTTTNHTPGPWIAHKYPTKRGYGFVIQQAELRVISIADICPGTSTDRIEPIAEANACLIAAAPELLAALEAIANDEWSNTAEMRKLARKAIAKATGD